MSQSSSFVRACTANRTKNAAALTEGRYLYSTLTAAGYGIVALGDKMSGAEKATAVAAIPFGTGADNTTGLMRVWMGTYDQATREKPAAEREVQLALFGSCTFTLSAAVGVTGGVGITSSERMADTLVWTLASDATSPKGIGSLIETTFRSPGAAAYSPASDVPALLSIPVLGLADILVFEPYVGTATNVNVLVAIGS
jgi:hypothetical protein